MVRARQAAPISTSAPSTDPSEYNLISPGQFGWRSVFTCLIIVCSGHFGQPVNIIMSKGNCLSLR